jgi:hypothetical protein
VPLPGIEEYDERDEGAVPPLAPRVVNVNGYVIVYNDGVVVDNAVEVAVPPFPPEFTDVTVKVYDVLADKPVNVYGELDAVCVVVDGVDIIL